MATKVGDIALDVTLNGRALATTAARLGATAGRAFRAAFNAAAGQSGGPFNDLVADMRKELSDLDKTLNKVRESSKGASSGINNVDKSVKKLNESVRGSKGLNLNEVLGSPDRFRVFVENSKDVDDAIDRITTRMKTLNDEGKISDERFNFLNDKMRIYAERLDTSRKNQEDYTRSIRDQARELGLNVGNHESLESVQRRIKERTKELTAQNKELTTSLRDLRAILKDDKSFSDFARRVGDSDRAVQNLNDRLGVLQRSGKITGEETNNLSRRISELDEKSRTLNKTTRDTDRSMKAMNNNFQKSGLLQRAMRSHVGRTILAWSALIAIIGQATAVLGSGVGSSVTMLITQLGALAAGIGIAVVAFQGMFDAEKEVVAAAQPAKDAIQEMMGVFSELQGVIQGSFFEGMGDSIRNLTEAISGGLTEALSEFAGYAGGALTQIFDGLSSPEAIQQMKDLLAGFGPILSPLVGAAQELVSAFTNIFILAAPHAEKLAQATRDLFGQFNEWTKSEKGRESINKWLDNMEKIMGPVIELAGALGKMLSDLVTDESIEMFQGFVQGLIDFMPHARALFNIIGELRILELVTGILNSLGDMFMAAGDEVLYLADTLGNSLIVILEALQPAMEPIGDIIGVVAKLVGDLVVALTPLLVQLIDFLVPILEPLADFLLELGDLLFPMVVEIIDLLNPILETLAKELVDLGMQLFPILLDIVKLLIPIILELIESVYPIVERLFPIFADLLVILAENFAKLIEKLIPVIEPLIDIGIVILEWIVDLLPPLIDLLEWALPLAIDAVMIAFDFLGPILQGVLGILDNFAPYLDSVIEYFGHLIDFITGVFSGDWEKAWKGIAGVFSSIWTGIVGFFQGVVNSVIDGINLVIDGANALGAGLTRIRRVNWTGGGGAAGGGGGAVMRMMADGGVVTGPTRALLGEAGPELVIPLNRDLARVDPTVREISGLLQGITGGVGGRGGGVTIQEGAITVVEAGSPRATAITVMNELAERIGA